MDIQDLGGSQLEQTYVPEDKAQVCPGCASAVNSGDRFCQECGTRIGTNRSKRASVKDKSERIGPEAGSASIICINCGTTNKAFSTVCSDCKIPLIPAQRRREDNLTGEQNGLRGSLTTRSRRPVFKSHSAITGLTQAGARDSSNVQKLNEAVSEQSKIQTTNLETAASATAASSTPLETPTKDQATEEPLDQEPVAVKKTRVKQRLPGFVSPIFKRPISSDTSEEGAALDFLFTDSESGHSSNPFDRLISETRNMGSSFSISVIQYHIDSFFERIPLPVLFLGVSIVIVCVTVTATTHWNRYEQRLKAIDKIAINAEEKMRAFRLDEVINTMQELEKTEKGDLPPRARAVLDQSLWLRSYSFAKQHEYAKAIADLSFVSANFISFEDVVEKLAEYKKLLASHPEFSGPIQAQKTNEKKDILVKTTTPAVVIDPAKKAKSRSQSSNSGLAMAKTVPDLKQQLATSPAAVNEKPQTLEKTARPAKSQSALLDRDMKRYSNLLVEYFSSAESGQSDHVAEPPSYEEWTKGGKRDF